VRRTYVVPFGPRRRGVLVGAPDLPGPRALLAAMAVACGAPRPRRPAQSESAAFTLPETASPDDLGARLRQLEQWLDESATADPADALLLHASAVTDARGRTLLFAGPSGAGKTTAAAALALQGGQWVGDECLPYLPERCAVDVCRRPVALRPDVTGWITSLAAPGSTPRFVEAGGKQLWISGDLPRSRARRLLPLDAIIVLPWSAFGSAGVASAAPVERSAAEGPLDAGAAFAQLLACCHHFQARGQFAFRALAELCRRVPAYRLEAREGASQLERLQRLLDHAS